MLEWIFLTLLFFLACKDQPPGFHCPLDPEESRLHLFPARIPILPLCPGLSPLWHTCFLGVLLSLLIQFSDLPNWAIKPVGIRQIQVQVSARDSAPLSLRPTFSILSVGKTTVSHSEVCLFLCGFSEFICVDHCLVPSQSLIIVY